MMDYLDFYDLAEYGNKHWKGNFTQREVVDNAYTYKVDYDYSVANRKACDSIKTLLELLKEDSSEEVEHWYYTMITEIYKPDNWTKKRIRYEFRNK